MKQSHDNFDPSEIEKFDCLGESWWDQAGHFRTLHALNPLRVSWIQSHLGSFSGQNIADVGCGGGILAEAMAVLGAKVTAIDLSEAALEAARAHAMASGVQVDYRCQTVGALRQMDAGLFDGVTCLEMLEHVPDPEQIVRDCAALVHLGGRVFFSTLHASFKSYLFAVLGAEYLLRLLPIGTHDWQRFIAPAQLARYCRQAGLWVEDMVGVSYNPVSKQFSLSSDVSVNYLIQARRVA